MIDKLKRVEPPFNTIVFVSIYQSYYGREETKDNRSEWCGGRVYIIYHIEET